MSSASAWPDGTAEEFHWVAFGDKQLPLPGTNPTTGKPEAQLTFDMTVAATRASRLELDKAQQVGVTAAGELITPQGLDAASDAAVSQMVPMEAFGYVPHEDMAFRPTDAVDMSDGPLGDWRWGHFSPEMQAAFEASIRAEVVSAVRDVANGQPNPYIVRKWGIRLFDIDIQWPIQELANELDKEPIETFERIYSALAAQHG